jgi:glutamate racemase
MIGVFDSGVGGLTVVKEIFKQLPANQIIYFGDTARLPYGTKGADFVKKYSAKITGWLLGRGAKIIVVACNTSSAWAADYLKKEFPNVPIFEMINPAVASAKATGGKRIGIIGTPGTIRSKIYEKRLKGRKVFSVACPLLVPMVEEGMVSGKIAEEIVRAYCATFKDKKVDSLILGCTHYPLLQKTISKIMGKSVKIINPAEALAKSLKEFLKNNPDMAKKVKKGSAHQFFFSDTPYNLEKISHLCFKKKIKAKVHDPF